MSRAETNDSNVTSIKDVKSWLGIALDAWFGEEAGRWAFQPFALSIWQEPDVARDLARISHHRV